MFKGSIEQSTVANEFDWFKNEFDWLKEELLVNKLPNSKEFYELSNDLFNELDNKKIDKLEFDFIYENEKKRNVYFTVTNSENYKSIHLLYDWVEEYQFVIQNDKFYVKKNGRRLFTSTISDNTQTFEENTNKKDIKESYNILNAIKVNIWLL